MATHYTRFLEILKKWPVDKTRTTHCFGQYLRDSSSVWFTKDGRVIGSTDDCTHRLNSLEKLANNFYGEKYSTSHIKTVTGMNAEQCRDVIIDEFVPNSKPEKK